MMSHPRILIQLDSDAHASVFDAVVAVDSTVDHLLQYAGVKPGNVRPLVHGAMFTRGPEMLRNTAIYVGGSDVGIGESIGEEIKGCFFGPVRVSVMFDGNGSNTTAAAAVLCAARHVSLADTHALVLGGTGPVGLRVARLLLGKGARVMLASRNLNRAEEACQSIRARLGSQVAERLVAVSVGDSAEKITERQEVLNQATVVFSCGAAGAQLLDGASLSQASNLQVAIDLNAVPPAGIEGIGAMDKAVARGRRFDYGAIGVGGLKMKIHRQAIERLFSRNDLFLDAEEILAIGEALEAAKVV
jgi:methylenetetrahydrofolate/methylenetetrahydromethanopterin dehydrogenase (NADP+)